MVLVASSFSSKPQWCQKLLNCRRAVECCRQNEPLCQIVIGTTCPSDGSQGWMWKCKLRPPTLRKYLGLQCNFSAPIHSKHSGTATVNSVSLSFFVSYLLSSLNFDPAFFAFSARRGRRARRTTQQRERTQKQRRMESMLLEQSATVDELVEACIQAFGLCR